MPKTKQTRPGSDTAETVQRQRALELSAEQAKAANVDVSEADLTAIVAESIEWARRH